MVALKSLTSDAAVCIAIDVSNTLSRKFGRSVRPRSETHPTIVHGTTNGAILLANLAPCLPSCSIALETVAASALLHPTLTQCTSVTGTS